MTPQRRAACACATLIACLAFAVQIAARCEPPPESDQAAWPSLESATPTAPAFFGPTGSVETGSPEAPAATRPAASGTVPGQPAATSGPEPTPQAPTAQPPEPARALDARFEHEAEATMPPAATGPTPQASPTAVKAPQSMLRDNQLVVYYGTPLASGLGILGMYEPNEAALAVKERSRVFDELNGESMGAVGALDVIYSLAQAEPTNNGLYVRHLPDRYVEQYLRVAEEHDVQLILDLQIGRARIIDEVKNIERFLQHPRVHVAIDPEYAVGPDGVPIATPGRISGEEINEVQEYLAGLVEAHDLPPKLLVLHQYMDETITGHERVETVDAVDYVLNMDAFGEVKAKKKKYRHYASRPPEHKLDSFNIFLKQDHAVLSEAEVLELSPVPHVIFYQ